MRQVAGSLRVQRVAGFAAVVLICLALAGLQGCKGKDGPNTSTNGLLVEATGAVQATASVDSTVLTSADVPTSSPADAANALAAAPAPKVSTLWPAKVGSFAKRFSGPVWYPKVIPKGYKTDSMDIVELEPGSGLICDIIYVGGDKSLGFTQGSPKTRDYEILRQGARNGHRNEKVRRETHLAPHSGKEHVCATQEGPQGSTESGCSLQSCC